MMEVVPISRVVGYSRGGYSRHIAVSARRGAKHNGGKAKFICPKCGTIFYAKTKRPHCPVDDYGLTQKVSVNVQTNYIEASA